MDTQSNRMNKYKIPVSFEVLCTIEIEANSLEEAIKEFDKYEEEVGYELPHHDGWEYIDRSFKREDDEFCKMVNE